MPKQTLYKISEEYEIKPNLLMYALHNKLCRKVNPFSSIALLVILALQLVLIICYVLSIFSSQNLTQSR